MNDAGGWITRSKATRGAALCAVLVAVLLAASATIALAGSGRSARPRAPGSSAIGFSHATVVDQQRPGFEPGDMDNELPRRSEHAR
jgi:hypothetical protein